MSQRKLERDNSVNYVIFADRAESANVSNKETVIYTFNVSPKTTPQNKRPRNQNNHKFMKKVHGEVFKVTAWNLQKRQMNYYF